MPLPASTGDGRREPLPGPALAEHLDQHVGRTGDAGAGRLRAGEGPERRAQADDEPAATAGGAERFEESEAPARRRAAQGRTPLTPDQRLARRLAARAAEGRRVRVGTAAVPAAPPARHRDGEGEDEAAAAAPPERLWHGPGSGDPAPPVRIRADLAAAAAPSRDDAGEGNAPAAAPAAPPGAPVRGGALRRRERPLRPR